MNNRIFFKVLLILIVTGYSVCKSQTKDIYTRFVNYTENHGLSHNRINDIVQDTRGFLWFATENGLSRFDGYVFTNYYSKPNDSLTIPGDILTSLAVDGNETLWIGTTEGLCKLSLQSGKIQRIMAEAGNFNTPRTNHIRKLYYSQRSNTLWIETLDGTLSSLNLSDNQWEHFSHPSVTQPYYRYHSIFEDSKGNIWFGGRNTPIMQFDTESKTIKAYKAQGLKNSSKRDDDTGGILETSKGDWFVTGLDGIYQFYPETERFERIFTTSTYSIVEDDSQIIWFASGNGLLSYNAKKKAFTIYQNDQYNPYSLINNHINKVYLDRVGNIWMGTRNGVSMLGRKNSQFSYYYNIPNHNTSLSSNSITALAQDSAGLVYIGTAYQGINIWEPQKSGFVNYKRDPKNSCSISSDRVSNIYIDKDGEIWVGLWAGVGFNKFDPQAKCFTRYAYDYSSLRNDWYNDFLEDSDGNFIAGMWGASGAIYFDRETGKFTDKHFLSFEKPYFRRNITQIVNNGDGNYFFLSSNTNAVYRYNANNQTYSSYSHPDNVATSPLVQTTKPFKLPFNFESITCMATDGVGLTLFGTNMGVFGFQADKGFHTVFQADIVPVSLAFNDENIFIVEEKRVISYNRNSDAINKVNLKGENFRGISIVGSNLILIVDDTEIHYVSIESGGEMEPLASVSPLETPTKLFSLLVDGKTLWIGAQKGLIKTDIDYYKSVNQPNIEPEIVLNAPVTTLTDDGKGSLLAFTPLGVYRVNKNTNGWKIISLKDYPEGFTTAASCAAMVNADTVWVGTETGHFQIVLSSGDVIETLAPTENTISSRLTSKLLEDSNGNIWIGTTDKGLNRVDKASGKILHFLAERHPSSLPSNYVNAILEGSDGKIWVGTDKGLCYIVTDFVVRIDQPAAQQNIHSLQEDADGLVWAATSTGLACIDVNNWTVSTFDESHGIPSVNFSKPSLKLLDNQLAFGTEKGFFVFDPKVLTEGTDYSGDVWLTQLSIFGEPQRYHFKRNDAIKLHYKENFIKINFSASDFGTKPGTIFRYKLNEIDPQWVKTNENEATYTNVPPGKYLFEVTKILPDGTVHNSFASLRITIPPPFWRTIWFRGLIILLIISGISAYLFTYIRQLNADRLNVELEQKLLTSQMNPHFIFNSLSAIQSFMYSNQPEEAGNYLSSFSRLVRLILENSRSEYISINQEVKTLELYLTLQKLRFPDKFDFEIDVSPDLIESTILVPPMLAQPFIENSIEHGILHKVGNGFIQISMSISGKAICIAIEDDGIGVEKSKSMKIDKRLTHTSYATSITRERIKNIAKSKSKDHGIKIVDLSSEGKQGTRVELRFPFKERER